MTLLSALPPRPDKAASPGEARFVPFDRMDPRWHEPLLDVTSVGLPALSWYARTDGANAPYNRRIAGSVEQVFARASVVERLVAADRAVQSLGYRILTVDAWRPVETQQGLWDFVYEDLARQYPNWSAEQLEARTKTFVSDPRRFDPADDTTWPIHSTGGSVDVLLTKDGTILDHGAGFDEATDRSFTDFCERQLQAGEIPSDNCSLVARRILVNAMVNAGFTNYAYEFWHFDLGTQLHVLTLAEQGAPNAPRAAWYGTTRPAGY